MAIVRGASTTNEVNGPTTVDLAVPAAAVGDVILFVVCTTSAAVGGDAALTEVTAISNAAGERLTVWRRVVDGTEPATYAFTGLSGRTSAAAVAYSGVDTALVLDAAPGTDAINSSATADVAVTTATDNALLFGVGMVDAATAADISAPPEQTEIWKSTGTGRRTVVSDEILPTAGTATRTWTQTSTLAMAVALVPLREAAAPAIGFRSLGQVQVWSSAPSATFVVPKPAGLAVGDLMLASVTTNGVGITLPAGWATLYDLSSLTNPDSLVCYKIADATDVAATDFTFTTAAATYGSAEIGAYMGVDQSTPIDFTTTPFVSATDTATFTVPAGTTVTDGALLVGGASANTGVSSSSWTLPASPAAWVDEWNPATGAGGAVAQSGGKSHVRGRCEPALPAGTTTGDMTFTLSVSRAGFAWAVGLRPGSGGAGAPAPVLSTRIVGVGDDSTSGRVAVRVTNATAARLRVSTDPTMATGLIEGLDVTPDSDGNAHLTVGSLTAGTTYYYRVVMTDADGAEHEDTASSIGTLRTAPVGPTSFAVDFSSCCDSADSAAMGAVAARDDDLFLHLGDLYYSDGSGTDLANFRTKMKAKIAAANHQAVMASRPFVYTPSDHDGMSNNTTAGLDPTAWTNWNTAFRELFPTPALPGSTGVYYTFVWGRIRFIVADGQSFKSNPADPDDASKTYWGAVQKQWVKDTITAATEPVIVIVNNNPWIGAAQAGDDAWLGYTTERTEMADFYVASGKNIIITGGDQHCVAADDGTNSPGGVPVVHASPLNNTASTKGGPYSEGIYPSGSALVEQYGRLAFTDDGSTITVDYTGYSADDTARVSMQKVYVTAAPASGSTAGSMSLDGSATGSTAHAGTGEGLLAMSGSATGTAPTVAPHAGSASGLLSLTGSATGSAPAVGTATGTAAGTLALTGTATGRRISAGSTTGSVRLSGTAFGPNSVVRDLKILALGAPASALSTTDPASLLFADEAVPTGLDTAEPALLSTLVAAEPGPALFSTEPDTVLTDTEPRTPLFVAEPDNE